MVVHEYFFSSMTVIEAMRSGIAAIFMLLAICPLSSQQPLMLSRPSFKGLEGVIPSAQLYSFGFDRVVYYHDQAIAVIDIKKNNEMQNCDIIEVYEPNEAMELLTNLSTTSRPTEISFIQMTSLMMRCQALDVMHPLHEKEKDTPKGALERANLFSTHALNLFSGIVPGTKWCGSGDVAENYHDLGIDAEVDRCCRTHDLCPVKIRAHRSRYNLTNYSLYSKSHCDCDTALYHCLKHVDSSTANIMGKLYFNIVKVGCIEDFPDRRNVLSTILPSKRFVNTQLSF